MIASRVTDRSMACSRFLTVIVTATVVLHCSSIISAQDYCGVIGDDTQLQFQVNATEMFYLDVDHPACCNGTITSWRVCYYGPADDDSKPYCVKYAVYRPVVTESNDTGYHLVPGSNRSTILCSNSRDSTSRGSTSRDSTSRGSTSSYRDSTSRDSTSTSRGSTSRDSTSRGSRGSRSRRSNNKYDRLYTGGFHCYEQSLDAHSHVVIEEGDVVGACVVDPEGDKKQLNIVSKVSGQSPDSVTVQLRGTKQMQYINLCQEDTNNILNSIILNQLSVISSTRLHLSANITIMGN